MGSLKLRSAIAALADIRTGAVSRLHHGVAPGRVTLWSQQRRRAAAATPMARGHRSQQRSTAELDPHPPSLRRGGRKKFCGESWRKPRRICLPRIAPPRCRLSFSTVCSPQRPIYAAATSRSSYAAKGPRSQTDLISPTRSRSRRRVLLPDCRPQASPDKPSAVSDPSGIAAGRLWHSRTPGAGALASYADSARALMCVPGMAFSPCRTASRPRRRLLRSLVGRALCRRRSRPVLPIRFRCSTGYRSAE